MIEQKAAKIYSHLTALSIYNRKEFYKELSPELKSELWKVQLKLYLSKHPDLTDKQRQAIESVIAFLKPQIYEIPQDSPDWEETVNKPVQHLTKRILEVFPRGVAREFLTVLGGSESPVSLNVRQINFVSGLIDTGCASISQEANPLLAKKKIKTQQQPFMKVSASLKTENCDCSNKKIPASFQIEDCECSTSSDWCWFDSYCEPEPCRVKQWCGTAGLYICNGLCIYDYCVC